MSALFLSRLTLRRDASTRALAALLDPEAPDRSLDTHHRLMWSLFADDEERKRDFLWRADGDGRFLVLSGRAPEDAHALFEIDTKPFGPELTAGDRLRFSLRANAVVSRWRERDGRKVRVRDDVVMDRIHHLRGRDEAGHSRRASARDDAMQAAGTDWLAAQGRRAGFAIEAATTESYRTLRLPRRGEADARFGVVDLTGVLTVDDPDALVRSIGTGFGKAKAFGCGLMLVRRA